MQDTPRLPQAEGDLDLAALLDKLKSEQGFIIKVCALFVAFAFLYGVTTTPVYETTARLRITPVDIEGIQRTNSATEREILSSRAMLESAVTDIGTSTIIHCQRPSLFSRLFIKLGLSSRTYNPAHCAIHIPEFRYPASMEGSRFELEVEENNKYELDVPGGEDIESSVGALAIKDDVQIKVSEMKLPEDTEVTLVPLPMNQYISHIASQLKVVELGGKQSTNIMLLSFKSSNPYYSHQLMNQLLKNYADYIVENQSKPYQSRLNKLKANQLEIGIKKLNLYESMRDTLSGYDFTDVPEASKLFVEQLITIERQLITLQTEFIDLSQKYTDNHPAVKTLMQQMASLLKERDQLRTQLVGIPSLNRTLAEKDREIEAVERMLTQLNQQILNTTQELATITPYATVIDPPKTNLNPVWPHPLKLIAISGIIGFFASILILMMRNSAFFQSAQDAEQVAQALSLPVITTVKVNYADKKLSNDTQLSIDLLAKQLDYLTGKAKGAVVAMASTARNQGKTHTLISLANTLKDKKKVLIIDCCIANASLHNNVKIDKQPGLAELVIGSKTKKDVIKTKTGIDIIPAGQAPQHQQSILNNPELSILVDQLRSEYDLILLNLPSHERNTINPVLLDTLDAMLLVVKQSSPLLPIHRWMNELNIYKDRLRGVILTTS